MTANSATPEADRLHLQHIAAGLNDGIILLEGNGAIAWANASALSLHGADELDDLGGTPEGYRKRYTLAYPNQDYLPHAQYPLDRLAAAETFDEPQLELGRNDGEEFLRQVRARGLNLDGDKGAYRVLILHDQTGQLDADDHAERKRFQTELLASIEALMQDTVRFSRGIIEKLAQLRESAPATRDATHLAQLTAREREVLGLLCQGHDDDGIAETLKLSRNTVRNHVATIYSKIGVHRRSAAIVWARDRGITGHEHKQGKPPAA